MPCPKQPSMPDETTPRRAAVSASSAGTSGLSSGPEKEQLSLPDRVRSSVSTAAMDRGVLMAAMGPRPTGSLPPTMAGPEGYTDAEVMLRVKAGDQSAFDYLVQKYRRPMVSFMYRMARNTAAAEDLAQEVFLRVYRSRESLRSQRQVHHLAVSHCDQSGGESRARHAPRTPGSNGQPG
jgi:RNA polymerase sigma-70 factor (ECF subfamily)